MGRLNLKPIASVVAAVALASGIATSVLTDTAEGVATFEGLETVAYADLADPAIATVCYGETQGVKFGDTYTQEQCAVLLLQRIPDYILPIKKLVPGLAPNRQVAYGVFAWNLGVGALTLRTKRCVARDAQKKCTKQEEIPGTSIVDLERAGNPQAACARMLQFDKAKINGTYKVLPGLSKRRKAEYRICIGSEVSA